MHKTNDQRRQLGSGSFGILPLLVIVGLVAYQFIYIPNLKRERVEELRHSKSIPTINDLKLIAQFEKMPTPPIVPTGEYRTTFRSNGESVEIAYYFPNDSTVVKELRADGITVAGSATYQFEGSVMKPSDVEGDLVLFTDHGEPIEVREGAITIYAGDYGPIVLEVVNTADP